LQPDVLLLDIQMPEMKGHEVLVALNKRLPQPKVIVVTAFVRRTPPQFASIVL
jgi:CheY-like chemotaxis protein